MTKKITKIVDEKTFDTEHTVKKIQVSVIQKTYLLSDN